MVDHFVFTSEAILALSVTIRILAIDELKRCTVVYDVDVSSEICCSAEDFGLSRCIPLAGVIQARILSFLSAPCLLDTRS